MRCIGCRGTTILVTLLLLTPEFTNGGGGNDGGSGSGNDGERRHTSDNYFEFLGARPSIYAAAASEDSGSSEDNDNNLVEILLQKKNNILPEQSWRLLLPSYNSVQILLSTNLPRVQSLDDDNFLSRDHMSYYRYKQQVLTNVYNDCEFNVKIDLASSVRLYVSVDQSSMLTQIRTTTTTGSAKSAITSFHDVNCDTNNNIVTLFKIQERELQDAIITNVLSETNLFWRRHLFHEKRNQSSATTGVREECRSIQKIEYRIVSRVLGNDYYTAATADRNAIGLNSRVNWFIRWNELGPMIQRQLRDSLPMEDVILELPNPIASILYFNTRAFNRTIVSLRDTLMPIMSDYMGITVLPKMSLLAPYCTYEEIEIINGGKDNVKNDDPRRHRQQLLNDLYPLWIERADRIGTIVNNWSNERRERKFDIVLGNLSSSKLRRNLLGEMVFELNVCADLTKSLVTAQRRS